MQKKIITIEENEGKISKKIETTERKIFEDGFNSEETPFDKFQLEEYKNISTSHYESTKQVSLFFRYYILILAAPAFILNIVATGDKQNISKILNGTADKNIYLIVTAYFIVVSFIGFFLYLYVVNLRFDAILYAKVVNKVRRYFYEQSHLSFQEFSKFSHLPLSPSNPKYFELGFFIPLVFIFSLINCGLLSMGLFLKIQESPYFGSWPIHYDFPITTARIIFLTVLLFLLHAFTYYYLSLKRENNYLKNYSIGIDIDGVLNEQTQHFSDWLLRYTGKKIDLNDLKEIPVSLNESLNVSDLEEKYIFNTKEYWEAIPLKKDAVTRIEQFQKQYGLEITIFTYRDWPQYPNDIVKKEEIQKFIISKGFTPLKKGEIKKITLEWLAKSGIKVLTYNTLLDRIWYKIVGIFIKRKKVILETGNPYISDTRFWNRYRKSIKLKNRFQYANLHGFKFFIEDNPENAIKLSNFCEGVILFDEPYNQDSNKYVYTKNIIRVSSWNDIYRFIKINS